jgi:membrane-bound lytic murein transglycosylase D
MIRELNPAYRRDIVPGATEPSPLCLPINDVSTFIDMQDSIFAADASSQKRKEVPIEDLVIKKDKAKDKAKDKTNNKKNNNNEQWHKVRAGDTLGAIARKYGTTVSKIKKLNGLRNDNLRIKQNLRVR